MTRSGRCAFAAVVAATLMLAGCAPAREVPTGDALVAQAEAHYLSYRGVTNEIQALIFEGPWELDIGGYGMQPVDTSCPDGEFAFDLVRKTRIDPDTREAVAEDVRAYLVDAGFEIDGMELGSGTVGSSDLIVRDQGDFSLLMVTFITNGSVLVSARTACWPGDRDELSDALFGGATLGAGYLPREEAPSDPLFFGVTPGEPGFLPSESPAP